MTWQTEAVLGGWQFTHEPTGARILIDFIRPTNRGLDAWVELWAAESDVPVSEANRNLMTTNAVRPFVEDSKRVKGPTWEDGLRLAFHTVIVAHRDGAATVDLTQVDPPPLQFICQPLIEQDGSTRLIAAGGSGKSVFSLALALTVATGSRKVLGLNPDVVGPVLYLDWETDANTHARRLTALCEPIGLAPPDKDRLLYRSESAPLFRSAQSVRRIADKFGAVMLVIDSAKMAAGPSGQGSGEDSTLNLYSSLREIGRPALIIDHKTKDDIFKGRRGGYGSVYNDNLARMVWEMTKLVDVSPTERQFALELSKENNTGRLPPIGFSMETTGVQGAGITTARFRPIDPDRLADPAADETAERIEAVLSMSDEPMTVNRIADMLYGVEEGKRKRPTVRTRLNQDSRFVNVSNTTTRGTGQWKLSGDTRTDAGEQKSLPDDDIAIF